MQSKAIWTKQAFQILGIDFDEQLHDKFIGQPITKATVEEIVDETVDDDNFNVFVSEISGSSASSLAGSDSGVELELKSNVDKLVGETTDPLLEMLWKENDAKFVAVRELSRSTTLKNRIEGHTVQLLNHLKFPKTFSDNTKVTKSGIALKGNEVENLSVIDIDINKSYNETQRDEVRTNLLSLLTDCEVVVKTGSGGLHIYCNTDYFTPDSNRMVKCFTSDDYDIDIFSSVDKNSQSLIVLPGSKVRGTTTADRSIHTYEFINGDNNTCIKSSVIDVLNAINAKVVTKFESQLMADQKCFETIVAGNNNASKELITAIINGFVGIEIHNDGGYMPLTKEVTLFTLFQAINDLPEEYIEQMYKQVYDNCKLTDSAKNNFENARCRYSTKRTNMYVLVKILRLYRNEYYEQTIKPIIRAEKDAEKAENKTPLNIVEIDWNDPFRIDNIRAKAAERKYKDMNSVANDLSRVLRFIDNKSMTFVQKDYDDQTGKIEQAYMHFKDMERSLKLTKLWKDPETKKMLTLYDCFEQNIHHLTKLGCRFYSTNPRVISLFHGFKYQAIENNEIIERFLKLVREDLCNDDERLFKYTLGWVATMIQKPGQQNQVALVFKGLQGTGKNSFTNAISEVLSGYSASNVADMAELSGQFNSVVENKMFVVLNEVRNYNENNAADDNKLKTLITEPIVRINEKNQPRRQVDNVANFVFISNNFFPVKISEDDRRHVVYQTSARHKYDKQYWHDYRALLTPEFYSALTYFFLNYNLTDFDVLDIPMTDAKMELIKSSRGKLGDWICDHYNQLCVGMLCKDALFTKPTEFKNDRTFQSRLKEKCNCVCITREIADKIGIPFDRKNRPKIYKLKDECLQLYSQTINDDDDVDFEDDVADDINR